MRASRFLAVSILTVLFTGCASNQVPAEKMQAPQTAPLIQRNFVVRDRSHAEAPLWFYDIMAYNTQAQGSDKFFVGDSGDVNDRIAGCELAKARARVEIAHEMTTFIINKITNTEDGQLAMKKMESSDGALKNEYSNKIENSAQGVLGGAQVVSTSWEERDYSQAGGANSVFNCKALIKISKKTIEDVVKKTNKKVIEEAPASARPGLTKTLAEAPAQFANQSSPAGL